MPPSALIDIEAPKLSPVAPSLGVSFAATDVDAQPVSGLANMYAAPMVSSNDAPAATTPPLALIATDAPNS